MTKHFILFQYLHWPKNTDKKPLGRLMVRCINKICSSLKDLFVASYAHSYRETPIHPTKRAFNTRLCDVCLWCQHNENFSTGMNRVMNFHLAFPLRMKWVLEHRKKSFFLVKVSLDFSIFTTRLIESAQITIVCMEIKICIHYLP